MYKRCLNIPKMITLQGICTWTTEALSFICCDCAHGAVSLSQSSPLSPQPARAIDYLGHCQREIRTGLTVCWLMLNQEKTHMMPAHFKAEVSSCSEKDLSPFCAACAPTFVVPIPDTGAALGPAAEPWELSARAASQETATICFRCYPSYPHSFSQNQVMATYATQQSTLIQFNSTGQYRISFLH